MTSRAKNLRHAGAHAHGELHNRILLFLACSHLVAAAFAEYALIHGASISLAYALAWSFAEIPGQFDAMSRWLSERIDELTADSGFVHRNLCSIRVGFQVTLSVEGLRVKIAFQTL